MHRARTQEMTPIKQCSERVTLKGTEWDVKDSPGILNIPGRVGALDPI